jgi:hypothetical protein
MAQIIGVCGPVRVEPYTDDHLACPECKFGRLILGGPDLDNCTIECFDCGYGDSAEMFFTEDGQ